MSRFLLLALAIGFLVVFTDKRPILVQSSEHIARQAGARGVIRCTYAGPRGLVEDEYRIHASLLNDAPSCPLIRPHRDYRNG